MPRDDDRFVRASRRHHLEPLGKLVYVTLARRRRTAAEWHGAEHSGGVAHVVVHIDDLEAPEHQAVMPKRSRPKARMALPRISA